MTIIKIIEDDENISIDVDGHSGYAPAGQDIVCAGISMLMHSWSELCNELNESNKIIIKELTVYEGHTSISIEDPYGYTLYALQMLKIGFLALTEQYPEYVRMYRGENDF